MAAAEAFRTAACGRVVAMLSRTDDAPAQVVRRLTSALDEPRVVVRPVLRWDASAALLLVGALIALTTRHLLVEATPDAEAAAADDEAADDK